MDNLYIDSGHFFFNIKEKIIKENVELRKTLTTETSIHLYMSVNLTQENFKTVQVKGHVAPIPPLQGALQWQFNYFAIIFDYPFI